MIIPSRIVVGIALLVRAVAGPNPVETAPTSAPEAPSRARVIAVEDRTATAAFEARKTNTAAMLNRGLLRLTDQPTPKEAWLSLVTTQDVVGIKVFTTPGATSGTRRAVVEAVVEGLLGAGLAPARIIVWDKHRADLRQAGYLELETRHGIRVAGSADAGYDETNYYDTPYLGRLVWGDLEFGRKGEGIGRKSFVSKLVSKEMTRIISITPLLNHNLAGVSGHLWGLALGSVDNTLRFEFDSAQMIRAVPEIYALPSLVDRVALNITDALICQYEGEERQLLHYSVPLNELWLSRDPVALDVLAIEELQRQRKAAGLIPSRADPELYENARWLELGVADRKRIDLERLP